MADRTQYFGRGEAEIDLEKFEADDRTKHELVLQYALQVKRAISDKSFKPPMLPETAIRLSELVDKTEVSIKEVENTVVRDPTVAARIVAVANSVFYNRGAQVRSLNQCTLQFESIKY